MTGGTVETIIIMLANDCPRKEEDRQLYCLQTGQLMSVPVGNPGQQAGQARQLSLESEFV